MKDIQHILLDLDRTLWDFDTNSRNALKKGIEHIVPEINPTEFISIYEPINEQLWELYRNHEIVKEELRWKRFFLAFQKFGIENKELAEEMADFYVQNSPYQTTLIEGTIELLEYLKQKYHLHIITNGFDEVQHIKIEASGLGKYFNTVTTSEMVGARKPHADFFNHVLNEINAKPHECMVIGDDFGADILGAEKAGMPSIFFNPYNPSIQHKGLTVTKLSEIHQLI